MRSPAKLGKHRGVYCAVYYERGTRKRASLGTNDREIAQKALAQFERDLKAAENGHATKDIAFIYEAYRADRESQKKVSAPRIAFAWLQLSATFAKLLPEDISKEMCRSYIKARRLSGASDGTTRVELGYLRSALRFARSEKIIDVECFIELPPRPDPRDHYLSRVEARKLIAAAPYPHVRLFIVLALATAGRAGALLDLTWDRVDLDRRLIRLKAPEMAESNKGRATVPVNDMALFALREAKRGAMSPFVIEWGGERVKSVKRGIASAATKAGLKCSPHVLRHTAAVWMAEANVPMTEIAQYLGHTDSRTTESVYARYSPDYLRGAASALEL